MKLTDLLIIYFACGAPFGVYQVTTTQNAVDIKTALQIALRIIGWPVFAVLILIEWFSDSSNVVDVSDHCRIDEIRLEIEDLVFENDSVSSIFDFREILNRYVGLSQAATAGISSNAANELLDLSGSKPKNLAAACLTRKNQRKLSFQHSLVRNEFVDMISEFVEGSEKRVRIVALAVELADRVNDSLAVKSFTTIMPPSTVDFISHTPEYDVSLVN